MNLVLNSANSGGDDIEANVGNTSHDKEEDPVELEVLRQQV
jgi:hypothetical protein